MSAKKPPNTPRKQATQARAKRTVAAIQRAAAHILKRDGPAKLTTNRIAEQANVSVGSIYQYFPNKQAILISLMTQQLERAMAARPAELDADVSLEEHMRAAVGWHLDMRRQDPLLFQRLFELQQDVLTGDERTAFESFHRESVYKGLSRHADEIRISDLHTAAIVVSHFMLAATQSATASNPALVDDKRYEREVLAGMMAYLTTGST